MTDIMVSVTPMPGRVPWCDDDGQWRLVTLYKITVNDDSIYLVGVGESFRTARSAQDQWTAYHGAVAAYGAPLKGE